MPREKQSSNVWIETPVGSIDRELYIYMKRLYLTAGRQATRAFSEGKAYTPVGEETLMDAFLLEFSQDDRRDDVHLGKCMHCMFNKRCRFAPGGCHFIDRETPVHRIAFVVKDRSRSRDELARYDCGWMSVGGIRDDSVSVMPDSFDYSIPADTNVVFIRPFSSGWSPYRAIPKRGETYGTFKKRIEAIASVIQEELSSRRPNEKESLRRIIVKCGHEKELHEKYGDDIMFMVTDWWPDMSPAEIIGMYSREDKVDAETFMNNRRRIEKDLKEGPNV